MTTTLCTYLFFQLVKDWKVKPGLLPPKRVFGNLQPQYVEKRREALEEYLQTLLTTFEKELPVVLKEFIEVDKYVSNIWSFKYSCEVSFVNSFPSQSPVLVLHKSVGKNQ